MTRGRCVGLLVVLGASAPAAAVAQVIDPNNGGGADLRLFRSASDASGYLSTEGADVHDPFDFDVSLVANGGIGLMPLRGETDDLVADAVPSQFGLSLTGAVGLFGFMNVGLDLPISFIRVERIGDPEADPAPGRDGRVPGLRNQLEGEAGEVCPDDPTSVECRTVHSVTDLADPVLFFKLRTLSPEKGPVGLAFVLRATFPSAARSLVGDPGGSLWPILVVESAPSPRVRVAANLGYRLTLAKGSTFGRSDDPNRFTYDDQTTFGLALRVHVVDGVADALLDVYISRLTTGGSKALSAEAIGGFEMLAGEEWSLFLAGGPGVVRGFSAAAIRLFAGARVRFDLDTPSAVHQR